MSCVRMETRLATSAAILTPITYQHMTEKLIYLV